MLILGEFLLILFLVVLHKPQQLIMEGLGVLTWFKDAVWFMNPSSIYESARGTFLRSHCWKWTISMLYITVSSSDFNCNLARFIRNLFVSLINEFLKVLVSRII